VSRGVSRASGSGYGEDRPSRAQKGVSYRVTPHTGISYSFKVPNKRPPRPKR
jgi:hypothetical protein